jgi:hypothetical protein
VFKAHRAWGKEEELVAARAAVDVDIEWPTFFRAAGENVASFRLIVCHLVVCYPGFPQKMRLYKIEGGL